MIESGSDSGSSGDSSDMSCDDEEQFQKEMEGLVDNDLNNLLVSFDQLPRPTPEDLSKLKVSLGEITRQKTLVLDMDETLIHAKQTWPADWGQDFEFVVQDEDGDDVKFAVKKRPHLEECLTRLAEFYELVVFTAAEKEYAEEIVKRIDPDRKLIKHLLTRDSCFCSAGYLVKDLRMIADRKLEDMIIIDNSIVCFAFNLDNGVPIASFVGDNPMDEELLFMTSYLEDVYHFDDIREANIQNFKLSDIQRAARK